MATDELPPQPGAGWDEAQCKAALARLEELQGDVISNLSPFPKQTHLTDHQVALLRLSLPRVMNVLASRSLSGTAMFNAFKTSVIDSQKGINSLRSQWHSQEVQSIFEHTTQSLEKDEDLTPGAQIDRWGWIESQIKEQEAARRKSDGVQKPEDTFMDIVTEDVTQDIMEFRKAYANIKVITKDDNQDLLVRSYTPFPYSPLTMY